jgi:tRNA threonylcarbamoyladenosine biosynthesis protein TsaE
MKVYKMLQAEAYITTRTEAETASLGETLGRLLKLPLVIALQGDLGAGKTVFVRGAAKGLEVAERVSSPTFVLLKIYSGRLTLYHFDFYRLSGEEDTVELGFSEYLPGDGVAFIEWAERLPDLLPEDYLLINIERFFDEKGEGRRLVFIPHGANASQLIETFIETVTWRTDGSLYLAE